MRQTRAAATEPITELLKTNSTLERRSVKKIKITQKLASTGTGPTQKLISHHVKISTVPVVGCLKMVF